MKNENQTKELYKLAKENNVVLYEALKTAYVPGFQRLIMLTKSGIIGKITDVDATFTKLEHDKTIREYDLNQGGGSLNELISYPLIAIFKLLGTDYKDISFYSSFDEETGVDIYTKVLLQYNHAIATANVGLGVKKEGNCWYKRICLCSGTLVENRIF